MKVLKFHRPTKESPWYWYWEEVIYNKWTILLAFVLTLSEGALLGTVVPVLGGGLIARYGTPESIPFIVALGVTWLVYGVLRYYSDYVRLPIISQGEVRLLERVSKEVKRAAYIEARTASEIASAEAHFLETWIFVAYAFLYSIPLIASGVLGFVIVAAWTGGWLGCVLAAVMLSSMALYPFVVFPSLKGIHQLLRDARDETGKATGLLGGIVETLMPWMRKVLHEGRREAVVAAGDRMTKLDEGRMVMYRRIGYARTLVLCPTTVLAGILPIVTPGTGATASTLLLMIGILASNYGLLGYVIEAVGKGQGDATALPEWLATAESKPLLPAPKERTVVFRGVSAIFPDDPPTRWPLADAEFGPGLHLRSTRSGTGKTTRFKTLTGDCNYQGSVMVGGWEAREYDTENQVVGLSQIVRPAEIKAKVLFGVATKLEREQALQWAAYPEANLSRLLSKYSGGQLRRLQLAGAYCEADREGSLVLDLDELTNDLDEETIIEVAAGLLDFHCRHPDMVILINSHNRTLREALEPYLASELTEVA